MCVGRMLNDPSPSVAQRTGFSLKGLDPSDDTSPFLHVLSPSGTFSGRLWGRFKDTGYDAGSGTTLLC